MGPRIENNEKIASVSSCEKDKKKKNTNQLDQFGFVCMLVVDMKDYKRLNDAGNPLDFFCARQNKAFKSMQGHVSHGLACTLEIFYCKEQFTKETTSNKTMFITSFICPLGK